MSLRFLSVFLLTFVLVCCKSGDDPGDVIDLSQQTEIPDPVFEQFLIDQGIDDVLDGAVNTEDIEQVRELDMTDIPVSDLTGLEDFTALRKFLVRSVELTSFDPNPNTQLRYLSTNGCVNLTSFSVNALTQLDTLYMSNNNSLTSLSTAQNTNLRSLHVIAANLETFTPPQGETEQFIDLILTTTKLTSVDLSPFEELELLSIGDNLLTGLDLSSNPNLLEMDCSGNPMTSLNLANGMNESLQAMNATNTNLDCIQIDAGFNPPTDGSWQKDEGTEYSEDCG